MARRVFYSFHYKPDNFRVARVRNIGVLDGNRPASDNDWETITSQGESAIKKWIAGQMKGKSCVIVLIGQRTAGRKWINYEIEKGWNDGKGLLGIHIHNLVDRDGRQSSKGANPFAKFTVGQQGLSSIVKTYDPPSTNSRTVYNHIANNVDAWIEEAINIRNRH